jgi:hypothetical protein
MIQNIHTTASLEKGNRKVDGLTFNSKGKMRLQQVGDKLMSPFMALSDIEQTLKVLALLQE